MQRTSLTRFFFLLASILVVTLALYWPGLTGTFLLDDLPNLSSLGSWPNQDTLTRSLLFLLSGDSGPTGRPLALLSFLMNDTAWPGSAFKFKLTNVLLHLLNGALVFWFLHRLLVNFPAVKSQALAIASVTTFLWLIHPLQVSTVLYVIQRMTELSALFTLAALIVWLYGRNGIANGKRKTIWMTTAGIGLFGLLAILSKENGALIPLYILTIEILFLAHNSNYTAALKKWLLVFSVIPSLFLVGYLVYIGTNTSVWQWRPFNLSERLLSESNVLVHYLKQIVIPNIIGMGIFHDDFPVTRSLFEPLETLLSVIIVSAMLVGAWFSRKQFPFVSFAIAWFFAGHWMESTFLPLELYFEHRNYLPMLGILLALVWGGVSLASRARIPVLTLLATYTLWLGILTYSLSSLWGQPLHAAITWAEENPHSIRAQMTARSAIQVYANKNRLAGEHYYLQRMLAHYPDKPAVQIAWLDFQCVNGKLNPDQLENLMQNLKTAKLHVTDLEGLQKFAEHIMENQCMKKLKYMRILEMLSAVEQNPSVQYASAMHIIHYIYSQAYTKLRDLDMTMRHLELAYQYIPTLDIRLQQAIYLYRAGLYAEALELLDNVFTENSPLTYKLRQNEIDQLKAIIRQAHKQASNG